jgi:hypothetical protein
MKQSKAMAINYRNGPALLCLAGRPYGVCETALCSRGKPEQPVRMEMKEPVDKEEQDISYR